MKKQTMRLVIDDQIDLDTSKLPAWIARALKTLEALPDGKLLTRQSLASTTKVSWHHTMHFTAHPAFRDYRVTHKARLLFGNPRTIAAAKEQLK